MSNQEYFLKRIIESNHDDIYEYNFLSDYKNMSTYMTVRHQCGKEYSMSPQSFINGAARCRECKQKRRDKARKEDVISYLKNHAPDYTLISDDVLNLGKGVVFKHNTCGLRFVKKPRNIMEGQLCPYCYVDKINTHEKFKRFVLEKYKGDFTVEGEYTKSGEPVTIRHKCGWTKDIAPNRVIKSNILCAVCKKDHKYGQINERRKTNKSFVEECQSKVGDEYTIIEEYYNAKTKILISHNICGEYFKMTPNNFLRGQRCPFCSRTRDKDDFVKKVRNLTGQEYCVTGDYLGSRRKIDIYHKECDKIFSMTPNNFLNGQRCANCQSSKGEKKISQVLDGWGIPYVREYRIKECRDKNPLPFDFCIMKDDKILILIEYDGEQHFTPIKTIGGKDALEGVIKRDGIKNRYCLENGINLLRIPYWEKENIESVLFDELSRIGLIEET